jgi:hypothetical protein
MLDCRNRGLNSVGAARGAPVEHLAA